MLWWLGISILIEGECCISTAHICPVRGKMSFIIGLDMTFHGTCGDSMPGKHCKIGSKNRRLLWEIHFLFLKTLETCCKSLLVWPQQLDFSWLQYVSGLFFNLFVFSSTRFSSYVVKWETRTLLFKKALLGIEMTMTFHDL